MVGGPYSHNRRTLVVVYAESGIWLQFFVQCISNSSVYSFLGRTAGCSILIGRSELDATVPNSSNRAKLTCLGIVVRSKDCPPIP